MLQYSDHLIWRMEMVMLGKTEGKSRREQQRMRLLDSITDSMHMNLSKLWDILEDRGAWYAAVQSMGSQRVGQDFSNWTTTMNIQGPYPIPRACLSNFVITAENLSLNIFTVVRSFFFSFFSFHLFLLVGG